MRRSESNKQSRNRHSRTECFTLLSLGLFDIDGMAMESALVVISGLVHETAIAFWAWWLNRSSNPEMGAPPCHRRGLKSEDTTAARRLQAYCVRTRLARQ